MARKLTALAVLLLTLVSVSRAQAVRVVLYNNSGLDLTVYLHDGPDSKSIQILPGERSEVVLPETPWIDFGIVAHRYETMQLRATGFTCDNVVKIQAESDGRLYLVSCEANFPAVPLPKQPAGYPLAPVEKQDLT